MYQAHRKFFLLLLGGIVLLGLLHVTASAAQTAPAALNIGVVDHATLEKSYPAYPAAMERLNKARTASENAIHKLEDGIPLDPDKFKEYQQATSSSVTVNEARTKELTDLAKKNMDELKGLYDKKKANKELTKDELARYDLLMKYYEDGSALLSKMDKDSTDGIKVKEAAYLKKIDDAEAAAITTVAKEKKLSLVLRKDVQVSEDNVLKFVLWGGNDITADVLKVLNEGFKESMFDDQPAAQPHN